MEGSSSGEQLPTRAVLSAHMARRAAAMERHSVSTTVPGPARAVCGQLVEPGLCKARTKARHSFEMLWKIKNTMKMQPESASLPL